MFPSQVLKKNLKQNPGSDSQNQTQFLLLGLKPILILEFKKMSQGGSIHGRSQTKHCHRHSQ